MSKVQETAPEEIFLIVGPDGDTDFEELFEVTWADKPIYEETAIKYIKQPKLSIPKKVADMLDKFFEIDFESLGHEEWWIQEHELIEWFSKTPNCYIKDAYLAGKALGVELVEVTDE